jgi:acetate---CoA ligase (ADP-forming)
VVAAAPPGTPAEAIVYPMARPGLELILGVSRDPIFGPIVLVGLGGVLTELLDDVALRVAPIGRRDALAMLAELRGARLLDGWLAAPAVDRDALADALVRLSRLAVDLPDVAEVDLNPVFAYPDGLVAADVRVVLTSVQA